MDAGSLRVILEAERERGTPTVSVSVFAVVVMLLVNERRFVWMVPSSASDSALVFHVESERRRACSPAATVGSSLPTMVT